VFISDFLQCGVFTHMQILTVRLRHLWLMTDAIKHLQRMGPSIMLCRAQRNHASLKAQTRVPLTDSEGEGGVTEFISYYTLKCDLVMTSVKSSQVLDSVLLKVNQCPSWYEMRRLDTVLLLLSTHCFNCGCSLWDCEARREFYRQENRTKVWEFVTIT